MDMLVNIPEYVLGYIKEQKGLDPSLMLVGMACRGNMPGSNGIYLFADGQTLNRLEGVCKVACGKDGHGSSKLAHCEFTETGFESFALDLLDELDVEELISGARLSIKEKSGELRLVCETPNTFKEPLMLFAAYVRLIMKNEFTGVEVGDKEALCPTCGRRYPDKNRICPYCSDNTGIIKKLFPFFKRYAPHMLAILLMLGITSALGVLSPYVSNSFYIDSVLTEGGGFYGQIMFVIFIMLSVRIAELVVNIINSMVTARVAANITYDLKKTIFSAINRLSLGFFNSRRTGGLMTQIDSDSTTLYNFFGTIVPNLAVSVVKIVAVAAVLFMMNPLLALITLITIPFYVFMVTRAYSKSRRMANIHYSKKKALTSRLSDVLSGLRVVKAFARERDESKHFHQLSAEKTEVYFEWGMYDVVVYPAISFVLYLGTVSVWALGGLSVIGGKMSYGDLLTFVAYMSMVYKPLNYIINSVRQMSESINAASRLFEIAEAIPDVEESKSPVIIDELKGEVEFRDVSFAYTKSKKTIDRVSFKIEAGSTLGIVGRTGAGKSTLVNLLIRLYDVTDGEILIDGVNVKDMSFEQLRHSVAIVSQETYLFSGTIFENIAYSMKDATYEEVVNAAIEAGAHDFIVKLPDGYETRIGFGYRDLSGGERQRISIARALLKKPKILILDEATAAMDTATEQKIEHAIERISGSCTTIMIAHRLSTLKSAEKLIVIEDGKVCESGTHAELLEKKGIYHKLYTLQLEALRNIISGTEEEKSPPITPHRRGPRPERVPR